PTAASVRKALAALTAKRKKDETILVALSGHGLQLEVHDPDEKGQPRSYSYFCPSDADFRDKVSYSTGRCGSLISLKAEGFDALDDCGAGARLVLMDCCRNEYKAQQVTRSRGLDVSKISVPEGVGLLFSCSSGQKAFETDKHKHGVFFHFVLEGLQGKAKN